MIAAVSLRRSALAALLPVFGGGGISAAAGPEIAPYRLTGIDGYDVLRYVSDDVATNRPASDLLPGATGSVRTRQAQSGFRNELFAMTHSYIYHPNLATLDIGGGPILYNEQLLSDADGSGASQTRSRGVMFNFSARANLLRDKPYRGVLFFEHLNPTVSIAPGQVLTQENNRYGFEASLLAPATPLPMQFNYTHMQSQGHGADRQIDDTTELYNFTASYSYGALGNSFFQFQNSQQESKSGSEFLPLQRSTSNSQGINFDTRLQFGAERQYDLINLVSVNSQRYAFDSANGGNFPTMNDLRFMLDLRARHSEQLHTYGVYNLSQRHQGDIQASMQNLATGLSYWPLAGLEGMLGLRAENSDTRQVLTNGQGVDVSLRYEHALPLGVAQISHALRLDERRQQALAAQAEVIGEQVTLSGIGYSTLGNPRVIAGSLLVSNATRTQTYIEGVDYSVSPLGLNTRLQRLVGGHIVDGETLLVDYSYDPGGTYAYREADQTTNLNWVWSRYVNVFVRQYTASPRLLSGTPSFPFNEVHSRASGLRADLPLNPGFAFTVGGGSERENRQETLAPYSRLGKDIYIQSDESIFGLGYLRAAKRRMLLDYGNPLQNSDLHGYELRYWAHFGVGTDLNAAISEDRDVGNAIPRRRRERSLGLQWRERKFTFNLSLVNTDEVQGTFERKRTIFQMLARRDF